MNNHAMYTEGTIEHFIQLLHNVASSMPNQNMANELKDIKQELQFTKDALEQAEYDFEKLSEKFDRLKNNRQAAKKTRKRK
jgi:hypothetical protein